MAKARLKGRIEDKKAGKKGTGGIPSLRRGKDKARKKRTRRREDEGLCGVEKGGAARAAGKKKSSIHSRRKSQKRTSNKNPGSRKTEGETEQGKIRLSGLDQAGGEERKRITDEEPCFAADITNSESEKSQPKKGKTIRKRSSRERG